MKKKNVKLLQLAFVLIIGLFLLNYMGLDVIPFSSVGFTTLSISNVSIESNPVGIINDDALAVTFASSGLGQGLSGTISAAEINSKLDDASGDAQKGFSFSSEVDIEKCFYPYQKSTSQFTLYSKVYRYNIVDLGFVNTFDPNWLNNLESTCRASYGEPLYWGKPSGSFNGYCVYGTQQMGSIGVLLTPKHQFRSKNTLTIEGSTPITKYISNYSDVGTPVSGTSADFSDFATLTWAGNLGTGEQCAVAQASQLVAVNTSIYDAEQSWKLADRSDAERYKQLEQELASYRASVPTLQEMQDKVNLINQYHDNLKYSNTSMLEGNVLTPSTAYGGAFWYESSNVQLPVFTLYIKASTLNIVQPVPNVSNLNAVLNNTTLKTGDTASISTSWLNDGATGNFSVSTSCSGAFTSLDNTINVSVSSNNQGFVNPRISSSCGSNQSGSCVVTVKALSLLNNGNSLSKTVSGSCSPEQICTPNQSFCSGDVVQRCSSDGTIISNVVDCASQGEFCANGSCQAQPPVQVCGDGVCSGTETSLTCAPDCGVPPCVGADCDDPATVCANRVSEDIWISGYEPEFNIFGQYVKCNSVPNWSLVGIIGITVIVFALSIVFISVYKPGKVKRRR